MICKLLRIYTDHRCVIHIFIQFTELTNYHVSRGGDGHVPAPAMSFFF